MEKPFRVKLKTLVNNEERKKKTTFVSQFSKEILRGFHDSKHSFGSRNDAEKFFNWLFHGNVSIEIGFFSTAEMKEKKRRWQF